MQASFDWISRFWGSTGIPECNEIWQLCDNVRPSWNTQECFNLWSNIQRVQCVPLQPHGWGFFLFCCYSAGREKWWLVHSTQWVMTFVIILCLPSMVWWWLSTPGCAPFQPVGVSLCNDSSQSRKWGVVLFSVLENGCCRNEWQQYAIDRAGEGMVKEWASVLLITYVARIKYK